MFKGLHCVLGVLCVLLPRTLPAKNLRSAPPFFFCSYASAYDTPTHKACLQWAIVGCWFSASCFREGPCSCVGRRPGNHRACLGFILGSWTSWSLHCDEWGGVDGFGCYVRTGGLVQISCHCVSRGCSAFALCPCFYPPPTLAGSRHLSVCSWSHLRQAGHSPPLQVL